MEQNIIGEPQLSHLLEFLTELGSAADDFVLAGAQAMRFVVNEARSTRDFDFVLNVIALREKSQSIADVLEKLQYKVVPEASRFQFFKQIPDSPEIMRVEFLAPEKDKRSNNFRVDVQQNIHARACTGAEIALRESDCKTIKGTLPDGRPAEISLRVICPHSLLMLKLFAMDDRYKNIIKAGGQALLICLLKCPTMLICESQAERWKSEGIYENNDERFIKIKFSKIGEGFELKVASGYGNWFTA